MPVYARTDQEDNDMKGAPPILELPSFHDDKVEMKPYMLCDTFAGAAAYGGNDEGIFVLQMSFGSGGLYHPLSVKKMREIAENMLKVADALEKGKVEEYIQESGAKEYDIEGVEDEED